MLNISHNHLPTHIVENQTKKKRSFHQLTNLNAVHHVHGTKPKQMNAFRSLILFPQKTQMTIHKYMNTRIDIDGIIQTYVFSGDKPNQTKAKQSE